MPESRATATPFVSAVIPTRNRSELVERAVRSALAQTHSAMEVVVVIDGPDSQTEAVLAAIEDPRLYVIKLGQSVGGAEARNAGVHAAKGEWIAFLDDDDEWLPEKIEKQLAVAAASSVPFPVVSCRMFARTPLREYIWPRRLPDPGRTNQRIHSCPSRTLPGRRDCHYHHHTGETATPP